MKTRPTRAESDTFEKKEPPPSEARSPSETPNIPNIRKSPRSFFPRFALDRRRAPSAAFQRLPYIIKKIKTKSRLFQKNFPIFVDFTRKRQEIKKRDATKIAARFKNRALRSNNQTLDALCAPIRERLSPIRRLCRTRPGRRPPCRRAFYGREGCWPSSNR